MVLERTLILERTLMFSGKVPVEGLADKAPSAPLRRLRRPYGAFGAGAFGAKKNGQKKVKPKCPSSIKKSKKSETQISS